MKTDKSIKKHTRSKGLKTALKVSTSINDLLARDDINEIAIHLEENKLNMTDCVLLYKDKNDKIHWIVTEDTLSSTPVFMAESFKFDILNDDRE